MKIFFLALALAFSSAQAQHDLVTIYTAGARGTYYRFAEDIKRACPTIKIQIIPSDGAQSNIESLIKQPILKAGARFAFVQEDTISADPNSKILVRVMDLYNEDITLIVPASSAITKFDQLKDKRVAIGVPGSGTWTTAALIQKHLDIRWRSIEKPTSESLLLLLTGSIDAMIFVGGHPLKMLNELGKSMGSRIKIADLRTPELRDVYSVTHIPADTYPWQPVTVELRATKAMLIAAPDVPSKSVVQLTSCIASNITELRRWGHPKWNEVQVKKQNG